VVLELELPAPPVELDDPAAAPGVVDGVEVLESEVPGVLDEPEPPVPAAGALELEPALPAPGALEGELELLGAEESAPDGGVAVEPVLGVLVEPAPEVPAPEELEDPEPVLLGVLGLVELGVLLDELLAPSSAFLPQPAINRASALAARTTLDTFITDFIILFLSIKL